MANNKADMTVTKEEVELVKVLLSQAVEQCQDEEEIMELMLDALRVLQKRQQVQESTDSLFKAIEHTLHMVSEKKLYSESIKTKLVDLLMALETTHTFERMVIGFFFDRSVGDHQITFKSL